MDKVSTEVPIMAIHISGHFSVVNSKALQILEITADTKNPSGGVIRRLPGSQEPNDLLEELASIPHLIMILWTTINRVSRTGEVMGPDERLTVYEALKSITIWGAYQLFEDDKKGTLKEGKLADLVILDKNPLKVDPMTLKDITVLETIKEGTTVYKK